MKPVQLRRIDYQWNKDGPLDYKSPEDVVKWVQQSGFNESIDHIIKDVNEYFDVLYKYGAVYDKLRYAEYRRDGINIRLNCGVERHEQDYYMEIWHNNTLVLRSRINARYLEASTDRYVTPLRFMACCMIYTSMILVDSILWNDSTDSINSMIIEEDLMKKTKAFRDEFRGHKMFAVWEVDNNGEKVGKYPLVSIGHRKAEALASHVEELGQFVSESNSGTANKLNTSKLSEDERSQLTSLLNKMS